MPHDKSLEDAIELARRASSLMEAGVVPISRGPRGMVVQFRSVEAWDAFAAAVSCWNIGQSKGGVP
jgi:hypothetical protein